MAGITKDTSFRLDGKTNLKIGEWGNFQWGSGGGRSWMGPIEIGPSAPVDPGIKVNVTLAGSNWDMHSLRMNMGAQFDVTIRDTTKGADSVWIGLLTVSHGPSNVVLTNASVQFINGGRGDDTITTGAGWVGAIYLSHGNNTVRTGKGFVDAIFARDGDDTVVVGDGTIGSVSLGHGNNTVTTGKGLVDSVVTRDGDDIVTVGSGGVEFVSLGGGNDTLIVNRLSDKEAVVVAKGGRGTDTVDFSRLTKGISWDADEPYVETRDGKFVTLGFENVIGTKANDDLEGNDASNVIDGGNGNDRIAGGKGADELIGGAGRDTFVFDAKSDSTVALKGRDLILDFSQKQKDRIDLSDMGDFTFIGEGAFTKAKGQVRYEKDGDVTTVYVDINGDRKADFAIDLQGAIDLRAGDFIL